MKTTLKFFFKNNRGQMILMGSFLVAIVSLVLLLLTQRVLNKAIEQTNYLKQEKRRSVLSAIVDHGTRELDERLIAAKGCNILSTLLCSTCTDWKESSPKIFAKGLFQLDIYDSAGKLTDQFEAPETDPKVWITKTLNENEFKLNVETTVCPKMVSGRTRFTSSTVGGKDGTEWGLGVDWNARCPMATKKITYSGILDQRTWGGFYTIYIDRGLYTNLAFEEPAENSSFDSEELLSSSASGYDLYENIQGVSTRLTGGLHDGVNGCGASGRTVSAYLQMIESIKSIDPCGKVAIYSVGGVEKGSDLGSAPQPGHLIRPLVEDPSNSQLAAFQSLQTDEADINSKLKHLCQKFIPGGEMNFKEVFAHYAKNHQPSLSNMPPLDRNKGRTLVIAAEASGPGAIQGFSESDQIIKDIIRANIYYQDPGGTCTGQGFISLSQGPGNSLLSLSGKYILNGDSVYRVTSDTPRVMTAPKLNPPIPPLISENQFLVQSVRRADTGACEAIIAQDSYTHESSIVGPEYPYLLPMPTPASPAGVIYYAPFSKYASQYEPITAAINDINSAINDPADGVKDYNNSLVLFPLPMVDLDEKNIMSDGYSKRAFDIGKIKNYDYDALLASYANLFQFINYSRFSLGSKVIGLENSSK